MIIDNQQWNITFDCSGRTINCCCGVVGIGNDLEVYQGHDGDLGVFDTLKLTTEEKVELADHMIKLWKQYRAAA